MEKVKALPSGSDAEGWNEYWLPTDTEPDGEPEIEGALLVDAGGELVPDGVDGLALTGVVGSPPPQATRRTAANEAAAP